MRPVLRAYVGVLYAIIRASLVFFVVYYRLDCLCCSKPDCTAGIRAVYDQIFCITFFVK
jgi:hypothetical protein